MTMTMTAEFTEKLIEEVRKRPIIYLLSHPDFKNNVKKIQAWREIAQEFNEETIALKAKWKNLKDTYKKYKQSKTNSNSGAKKHHNWVWASHMSFMDPTECYETQSSMTVPDENSSDNPESSNQINEEEMEPARTEIVRVQEPGISGTRNARQLLKRPRRNPDPTDRMIEYLKNRKRTRNNDKTETIYDGVDYMFLGYADTFKQLSKRNQVLVKYRIAKILMEAELSDIDSDPLQSRQGSLQTIENVPMKFDDTEDDNY